MANDDMPRIEPKIEPAIEAKIEPTLVLKDAPSIAADGPAKPEIKAETADITVIEPPKVEIEAPKVEARDEITIESKSEPVEIAAKPAKAESKPEIKPESARTLPPAPQLGDKVSVIPYKAPQSNAGTQGRSTRFALLAASVAIAASFGAVAGSLGVAKFGPAFGPAPAPVVAAPAKEHMADDVKALKETVAQLRATTKSLSDNFAALKTSVASSSAQSGKIAETLERLERGQVEQRKAAQAAPAAPETTGSIQQPKQAAAAPAVLGAPPAPLRHPVVQDWVLRRVYDGAALIEGRDGIIEVEPGIVAPGLGRIESIKRQDGRWVVVTSRGLVVGR